MCADCRAALELRHQAAAALCTVLEPKCGIERALRLVFKAPDSDPDGLAELAATLDSMNRRGQ